MHRQQKRFLSHRTWTSQKFVASAARLARATGVSPIVVGLAIIPVGTSIPELFVSGIAALQSQFAISIGTIIGSCIINLAIFLGFGTIIIPLKIDTTQLKMEIPFMIIVTYLFYICMYTGLQIVRLEGFILVGFYLLFTLYGIRLSLELQGSYDELTEELTQSTLGQNLKFLILFLAYFAFIYLIFQAST